jgi:hypothetical protein
MTILSDTTPAAQRRWAETYARLSPADKARRLATAFADARKLHAAGMRQRNPGAGAELVLSDWLRRHFGYTASSGAGRMAEKSNLDVLEEVLAVFNRLGIAHALGGSMASSLHGIARFTLDADVAAEPFPDRIAEFAGSLPAPYYLSLEAIQEAHRQHGSFNIIHTEAGFKVDVFISALDPFARSAMARRQQVQLRESAAAVAVQSPEDVILAKLRWFRMSGSALQNQWSDVLGVLRVQQNLDAAYLDHWAKALNLEDLLQQARAEAERT